MRFELDAHARRDDNGTALFGGSPFRLLRLSSSGSRMLDGWLAGEPATTRAERQLQRRLVDAGLLYPVVEPVEPESVDAAIVVPHHDDVEGLSELLSATGERPVVVVDDASRTFEAGAWRSARVRVLRHGENRGPAAARNTGWRSVEAEIVVFIDSDVIPSPGCVELLLAHFVDESVTAVAPRVRARPGIGRLDRYEVAASPLDLGPTAALVRPGSAVPYVPSTVLAVRQSALAAVGGFDEAMRVGEDVDLVWRLVDAGAIVRYEPRAVAHHRNRRSWAELARQRHGYGTAAVELDARHPGDVSPVELPPAMLAAWAVASLGGRLGRIAGAAISGVEAVRLRGKLADRVDDPSGEALRLTVMSHRHAAYWSARAVARAWLPIAIIAGLFSRRVRRLLAASWLGPAVSTWWRDRPVVDPATFVAASMFDDVAYATGVWRGLLRDFRPGVLVPRLARSSPGEPARTD